MHRASDRTRPTARVLATFVGARGHHYHATRVIARGGMAEVFAGFRADEEGAPQPVAIKRLDALDTPEALLAFDDEARIVSALAHPGIVELIDYGHSAERPFQILEHVDGLDLRHLVSVTRERDVVIPPALALSMVADAADALHAAHEACDADGQPLEVIHRDVSPHNILLSWEGAVKVADFGIAMWAHRSAYTAPGVVKGKLSFMAPEQLLGRQLDRRVDVFGLGCVLAYLFTGSSPFSSEAARAAALRGVGPALDEVIPASVARIVACAAAPDRAQRYPTALELGLACRRAARMLPRAPARAAWLRALHDRPPAPRVEPLHTPLAEPLHAPLADPESSLGIVTVVPTIVVVGDTEREGTQHEEPARSDTPWVGATAPLPRGTSAAGPTLVPMRDAAPARMLEAQPEALDAPLDRLVLEGRRGPIGRGALYDARDGGGVHRWVQVLSPEHGRDARVLGQLAQEVLRDRATEEGPGLRAVDFGFTPEAAWVAYEVVEGVSLETLGASIDPHDRSAQAAIAWSLVRAWRRARAWDRALGGDFVGRAWSLAPTAVWMGADGRPRLLDHLLGSAGTPGADASRALAVHLPSEPPRRPGELVPRESIQALLDRADDDALLRAETLLARQAGVDDPEALLAERVRALCWPQHPLPRPRSASDLARVTLPSSPAPPPAIAQRAYAPKIFAAALVLVAVAAAASAWAL